MRFVIVSIVSSTWLTPLLNLRKSALPARPHLLVRSQADGEVPAVHLPLPAAAVPVTHQPEHLGMGDPRWGQEARHAAGILPPQTPP